MFTIGKLTYLNIDKKSFSFVTDTKGSIDYQKWVKYMIKIRDYLYGMKIQKMEKIF